MINNINLQLFAEDEIESEVTEQEIEVSEELDNDTETYEREEEDEEEKDDRVPLNRFLEEKKKRKELERKMREFESKEEDSRRDSALEKIRKLAKEKDFDDDTAEMFAEVLKETMSFNPKSDPLIEQINEDLSDLAEVSPDVLKYKKEIIEKIKKFAKAGEELSVEEAYRHVVPQSLRYNEIQTDLEQKNALKRRESYENKQLNSSSKAIKSKYKLDDTDRKALQGLQKMQPDAGWNEEKYFKNMKG